MFNIRPPRRLPPRYTIDGVSVNQHEMQSLEQQRQARSARRAVRHQQRNGVGPARARADIDDGNDGDVSGSEAYNLPRILEQLQGFQIETNDSPRTDEIKKNSHSATDLSLMSALRSLVSDGIRVTRVKGPRNSVIYSPLPPPPSNPDIDEPSWQDLTFAWDKQPNHRYNRLASLLVAERFIHDDTHKHLIDHTDPGLLLGIAKQVRVHLRHLSSIWNSQQYEKTLVTERQQEEERLRQEIVRRSRASDHRRRLILDRRGATASYYSKPAWIAILNHAGAASMSSDDLASDDDEGEDAPTTFPVYRIISKSWRSVEFLEFLQLLDRLADVVDKRTKYLGRSARIRKPSPPGKPIRETLRPPFPNLNREFYSREQQTEFGHYHRYHKVEVDLQAALADLQQVAANEGVMV